MLQSPEIQTMYSLNMPVSAIRTKIRQEFEKHRYVNQMSVVDVLLFQSHAEFQVRLDLWLRCLRAAMNKERTWLSIPDGGLSLVYLYLLHCRPRDPQPPKFSALNLC